MSIERLTEGSDMFGLLRKHSLTGLRILKYIVFSVATMAGSILASISVIKISAMLFRLSDIDLIGLGSKIGLFTWIVFSGVLLINSISMKKFQIG